VPFRVTASLKLPVLHRLPDDSDLSVITPKAPAPQQRSARHGDCHKRHAILVHVVEYQIANRDSGEFYRLITTITDWEEALSPGPGRRLPPTLGRHTAGPNACTPPVGSGG